MKNIFITQQDFDILRDILQNIPYQALVFGSRIKGSQQKFSDLDICLKSDLPIPFADMATLKETLRESNLPFTVDVIDYHYISEGFKKIVDEEGINFRDTKPAF